MLKGGFVSALSSLVERFRSSGAPEPVLAREAETPKVELLESRIEDLAKSLDDFDRVSFRDTDSWVFKAELVVPILAARGDLETMREIFDVFPAMNLSSECNFLGLTALKNAILRQEEDVVDFLLQEDGANVNPVVEDGEHFFVCPLLAAATGNNYGTNGTTSRLFTTQDDVETNIRMTEKILDAIADRFEGDIEGLQEFVLGKSYNHRYSGSTKMDYWSLKNVAQPEIWAFINERVSPTELRLDGSQP